MRKLNQILFLTALISAFPLLLTGCKSESKPQTTEAKTTQADTTSETKEKIKVVIGTSGAPKPFTYVNENGQLNGYDIDVVKAIFNELPQYEISFETTEFPSVLAGLDSDRFQIGANSFAMNDKRKEKYLASNTIFKNQLVIAMAEKRTDINSFADLQGKTTEVQTGINYTTALEKYNTEHSDNPVNLKYTDSDLGKILQNVESGQSDFELIDQAMLNVFIKDFGLKLKSVKLTEDETKLIGAPYTYLLLSKGPLGEELQTNINKELKKLLENGTIGTISQKYFDDDFSPK